MHLDRTIRIASSFALGIVVALVVAGPATAAPRRYDPGSVRTMIALRNTVIEDASRHGSVRCVVASTWRLDSTPARIAFTCSNALASPKVIAPTAGHAQPTSVEVTDDAALIGGCMRAKPDSGTDTPLVMRLHHDGSRDYSFGASGRAALPAIAGVGHACVRRIDVLDDGRIIVAGSGKASPTARGIVSWFMRLLPNGTVDTTFGGGRGYVVVQADGALETFVFDMRVLADGRIFAVGRHKTTSTGYEPMAITLLADGSRDPAFGTNGVYVRGNIAGNASISVIVRLVGDARPSFPVAVTGSWNALGEVRPTVVRITESGGYEPGFGFAYDRKLPVSMYGGRDDLQVIPAVMRSGRVLIAAERPAPYYYRPYVTLLGSTGKLPLLRRFQGLEAIDMRPGVWESDEFVSAMVPSPGRPVIYGAARIGGRWVGERYTASYAAPAPAKGATLRVGRPGAVRRCGTSQRGACKVAAGRSTPLLGTIFPAVGPASHPFASRVVVRVHRLGRRGITSASEHRMRLVYRGGWKWVLPRPLAKGEYVLTMHRTAGLRVGVVESAPLWVTAS